MERHLLAFPVILGNKISKAELNYCALHTQAPCLGTAFALCLLLCPEHTNLHLISKHAGSTASRGVSCCGTQVPGHAELDTQQGMMQFLVATVPSRVHKRGETRSYGCESMDLGSKGLHTTAAQTVVVPPISNGIHKMRPLMLLCTRLIMLESMHGLLYLTVHSFSSRLESH